MGRCKELSVIICLIFVINSSAQTVTLEESGVQTYTLNPFCTSWPTYNDTAVLISGFRHLRAFFAFDLSGVPCNATYISATFSACFRNDATVPSTRELWYCSDDSWIPLINNYPHATDSIEGEELVGAFLHNEQPDDDFVWKSFTITYDGWANDMADGFSSLMVTGGQDGAVGITTGNTGYNWGVFKDPELTLTFMSDPLPITVTSPNGGESWQAGTLQTITWSSTGDAGANVKIELYRNNSYLRDIIVSTANDGEYTWLIPSNLSAGTKYKVKIIDIGNPSTYDYSDTYFDITDLIPPSGSLQFQSSVFSVTEDDGGIRIYVSRTDGSYGVASVSYATSNGTALAGSDYTEKFGTLYWADGDTTYKYFDISINNDDTCEDNENFIVSLGNAVGASLGNPGQATVFIMDDDSPSSVIYPPEVDTLYSMNITPESATLAGLLKNDGSDEIEENCICRFSYWKADEQGDVESTDWQTGVSQGQKFNATISGLDPNTEYLFYAQASNSTGTADGNSISFKTCPDPNVAPVAFEPNEPNTLLIQNFVEVLFNDPNKPHSNQGLITYVEGIGLNGLDSNDIPYSIPASETESKIVSLVTKKKTDFYELSKDVRFDGAQDSLLELSIYNFKPNDPNIYSENYLKFWLAKNAFKGKTVTIQKVSSDPNITYPVWDVNEIISKNGRKMPLDDLADQKLNVPYAWFTLSTSRRIFDLNEDGVVDLEDFDLLIADVGKTGIYRSDIACMKDTISVLGIPDGKVDENDVMAFVTEYNEENPADPITDPYAAFTENFESGQLQEPFTTSGNSPWIISSDSYKGNFSAKSGDIGNNQNSILEINVDAPEGKISFWRKVSSESGWDGLIFYIDHEQAGVWSGLLDWKQMSFQVAPGNYTLTWEYIKDGSSSVGQDSAWIDDIVIQ